MVNLKNIKTYLCILFLIGIISLSCTENQENSIFPDKYEVIQVELNIHVPAPTPIAWSDTKASQQGITFTLGNNTTRSGEIDDIETPSIENLWILQFDQNNTLIHTIYQDGISEADESSLIFELYESDFTTLFFIANFSSSEPGLEKYTTTLQDLQELDFSIPDEESTNNRLLTGKYEGRLKENTRLIIELERIVAKLSLKVSYKETLNNGDKLKITNIQLKNVPSIASFYNLGKEVALLLYPEENPAYFTDYSSQSVSGSGNTFVWYTPENLQGIVALISNQQMKGRAYAPGYSTYIELTGEYIGNGSLVTQIVNIRLYPGDNITTDFNIRRNTSYRMTVDISNLDPDNDERVTFS